MAFHPGHVVPGIDFTNDPLLQGRLFSNTDTQLKRLGSPNFHRVPRSDSFFDHFSQATLFYNSQSKPEKDHTVRAFRFELGKVEVPAVRERIVGGILGFVDKDLAAKVAAGLGITLPVQLRPLNHGIPADGEPGDSQPKPGKSQVKASSALSMADTIRGIRTRKVAILAADGFDEAEVSQLKKALAAEGAQAKIVAPGWAS